MAKFTQIEVTEADIVKADPTKSGRCVVATAIARCIPDATRIDVDVQTIRFTRNRERYVYVTPYPVSGYVVAFDRGDEIHPFTFRLNESSRVGMKAQPRTPAGKATVAAKQKVRDRKAKAAKIVERAADPAKPTPTRAERTVAEEAVSAAEAALAEVTAAYSGQKKTEATEGARKPPPRVFRTGTRQYGHRRLAINQEA